MTDEELIARLRNNPTDEEAALAATRIYNLGLLNDLAEATLEAAQDYIEELEWHYGGGETELGRKYRAIAAVKEDSNG